MKLTVLSMVALAAATGVSARPSNSVARGMDPMAQFASLHMLDKRGLSNGSKCKEDSECDSNFCMDNGWFRDNKCEAKLPDGHRCKEDHHCVSDYCITKSFWSRKTCHVNPVPKGSRNKGEECTRNRDCKTEVCEGEWGKKCITRGNGQSCWENQNCDSGFCLKKEIGNNHRCVATGLPWGQRCNYPVQCASKSCTNNFCD